MSTCSFQHDEWKVELKRRGASTREATDAFGRHVGTLCRLTLRYAFPSPNLYVSIIIRTCPDHRGSQRCTCAKFCHRSLENPDVQNFLCVRVQPGVYTAMKWLLQLKVFRASCGYGWIYSMVRRNWNLFGWTQIGLTCAGKVRSCVYTFRMVGLIPRQDLWLTPFKWHPGLLAGVEIKVATSILVPFFVNLM